MSRDPEEDDDMAWLRALTEKERAGLAEHPDPERLVAYAEGGLAPGEAEALRDHLALCPECTSVVLDFTRIARPAPEDALSDEEAAALWPELRESLREEGLLTPRPRRAGASPRIAWALAATLGTAVIGLSLWSAALRRENRELREPRANVQIVDLLPVGDGVSREERGRAGTADPPPSTEAVVLVLNTADLRSFPHYGLEIRAAEDDHLLWSTDRLARSLSGNFTLAIPRGLPGDGPVRLLLFGLEGGRREPLAEYRTGIRNER